MTATWFRTYLLRTNEPTLSADDLALGYKQFLDVERGWRDMKQILNPVHHVGQFTGPAGTYRQITTPATAQRQILTVPQVPTPYGSWT